MFCLQKTEVRIANLNVRPELHGEDPVTAVDLKIEADLPNDVLSEFHPTLKSLLYVKDEDQADLISQHDPGHMTRRRFPKLGTLKWEDALVGAKVTVHHGVSAKGDVVLELCDVNDFRFDPQEGGTVVVTFRVQTHPDEKQLGRLGMMTGCDVEMTLSAPEEKPAPAASDKPWPFPVKGSPAHIPGSGDGEQAA